MLFIWSNTLMFVENTHVVFSFLFWVSVMSCVYHVTSFYSNFFFHYYYFIYFFISLIYLLLLLLFLGRASTDSSAADTNRHEPHHRVSRLAGRRLVSKTKTWVIWVQEHERYPSGFRGSDCCSRYCLCYQGILTIRYRNQPFISRNTCMPINLP